MSASNNLSNELFFSVYRGMDTHPAKGHGLGAHWTTDEHIAKNFATPWSHSTLGGPEGHPTDGPQTIIKAQVPISSVETDTSQLIKQNTLNRAGKFEYDYENEVPVKKGAKVLVESISTPGRSKYLKEKASKAKTDFEAWDVEHKMMKRSRRINKRFNPPKEMQA